MKRKILITGGAGFIGSHLADELIEQGYSVRVLDCLSEQVHGSAAERPAYLNKAAELIVDDVANPGAVRTALNGVDAVCHLAAKVGVGQSMYQIASYVEANDTATAVLLEALIERPVSRLVVASSMSVYGEGLYRTATGALVTNAQRTMEQLKRKQWEPLDDDMRELIPVATTEDKAPSLSSVYALSKYDQEQMCLMVGRAYRIPTIALRFFNVYGPRQALSNPYTGVLAIFAARYLAGERPVVFEDGDQRRDFVNVHDVARACRLAVEATSAGEEVVNIGSGRSMSINEVARSLGHLLGRGRDEYDISGRYRVGDIRHCFADISRARSLIGYEPKVSFEEGLEELAAWLEGQEVARQSGTAERELEERGLTV